MSKLIYETENFLVETLEKPHVSRADGGHILISPKIKVVDRTQFSPELAIELMRLTMVAGEAMTTALNRQGVDVGRINYQDNGNWGAFKAEGFEQHIHIYGRAKNATVQKWGEALHFPQPSTGFYDSFEPLNNDDIKEIHTEIEAIFKTEKYQDQNWHL